MKYIFIVGLPRTGTKLVKNILQQSPDVCCRISAETWFFGDLLRFGIKSKIHQFGSMVNDRNVRKLVDYMYSGEFGRTYWNVLSKGGFADREWMLSKILASDRSDRSIYQIIMECPIAAETDVERAKEWVVGDKTPGHLYSVPEILAWFPDARIVHAFRDPRAILASEWRRIAVSNSNNLCGSLAYGIRSLAVIAYVTFTWLYAVKLHCRYCTRYPDNYRLSKYEDLVLKPEESVRELCEFVGIPYSEAMLNPASQGSSFSQARESGFNLGAIDRWRQCLKPWMKAWITLASRKHLSRFSYKA